MWKFFIFFVVLSTTLVLVSSCNTEYKTIHYHTYDCELAENEALGNFILTKTKQRRFIEERNTCSKMPAEFLKENPKVKLLHPDVTANRIAGAFVYQFYTDQSKVFWGVKDTLNALLAKKTLNLIVDGSVNYFILHLAPKDGNGEPWQELWSSLDLKIKMPKDAKIVRCENLFSYLPKVLPHFSWSVTLTDEKNSNAEYRYISNGIGGFYSRQGAVNA